MIKPIVLVVDDDYHVNLDILSYHLNRMGGFKILNAFTIKDFRKHANEADIIILDIRLPENDGDEVDPWGGLKALIDLIQNSMIKTLSDGRPPVIIRSVQTKEDAKRAGQSLPSYYCWLHVDAPLSQITNAICELNNMIPMGVQL